MSKSLEIVLIGQKSKSKRIIFDSHCNFCDYSASFAESKVPEANKWAPSEASCVSFAFQPFFGSEKRLRALKKSQSFHNRSPKVKFSLFSAISVIFEQKLKPRSEIFAFFPLIFKARCSVRIKNGHSTTPQWTAVKLLLCADRWTKD